WLASAPPMNAPVAMALVVEDDAALRMLCRVNLELSGFVVREAGDVESAEAALFEERPDVVFLDVHVNGRTTGELLTRLRRDGIPVAIVSGSTDIDVLRDGADAVLPKPFAPQELVDTALRLARVRHL
ncbi:MAG TPA: response regulator, partial [Gaiellaceae bacterium]|nr:response regulator [Gaiellaceae bacterium]